MHPSRTQLTKLSTNEFRTTWTELKHACAQPQHSFNNHPDLPDEDIILLGLSFYSGLSNHHSIEERFFFPLLATRIPEFRPSGSFAAQHEAIHDALVRLRGYLGRCERGEEGGLDRGKVRRLMESFECVLWEHLDREVEVLGAENMRRFWSLDEVRRFPA
ncbi:hypothetical protein BDW62DRAFT_179823 [Aspergillus aurantiobrunneus]